MIFGIAGILLPILPTTPFFLVTAYSFNKGSSKFSKWFKSQSFVRKHLNNITMTKRKKWFLNIIVDGLLIVYIIVFNNPILSITLSLIIVAKHYVFYKYVKTKQ